MRTHARTRQSLLPAWAPKRADAGKKDVAINAALAAVLLSYSLLHPSPGLQPMTAGMVAFFFRVNSKARVLWPCLHTHICIMVFYASPLSTLLRLSAATDGGALPVSHGA